MPVPLWATLVGISLAKKVTVLIAAKLYGIPRLYRRCQEAVRSSTSSPRQRDMWAGRVRTGFRLPQNLALAWRGQEPIATRFPFPGPSSGILEGAWRRPAALSFASAPLSQVSRRRMQDSLQSSRQRLRAMRAHIKQQSHSLKERGLQQLQRCGSQAQPSFIVEAATMQFIRHARQAYQFVPAIPMP